jgi:hypothetical protein
MSIPSDGGASNLIMVVTVNYYVHVIQKIERQYVSVRNIKYMFL